MKYLKTHTPSSPTCIISSGPITFTSYLLFSFVFPPYLKAVFLFFVKAFGLLYYLIMETDAFLIHLEFQRSKSGKLLTVD